MKVWVVMRDFGEEGEDIDSIHAARASAEDRASELDAESRRKAEAAAKVADHVVLRDADAKVYEYDLIGGEASSTRKPPPKPNPSRPLSRGG